MKLFHVKIKSHLKVSVLGKYGEMDVMVKKASHAIVPLSRDETFSIETFRAIDNRDRKEVERLLMKTDVREVTRTLTFGNFLK
jgi:hypothetical protein